MFREGTLCSSYLLGEKRILLWEIVVLKDVVEFG
jgi:hypothetical protein